MVKLNVSVYGGIALAKRSDTNEQEENDETTARHTTHRQPQYFYDGALFIGAFRLCKSPYAH